VDTVITIWLHKIKGFSRLAEKLLASQEELCSMDLDNCLATSGMCATGGKRRVWWCTNISGYTLFHDTF
jgi:hypothetical protein